MLSFNSQSGDFVVQVVASKVAVHWDEPPHVPQHAVHEVHAGREVEGLDGLKLRRRIGNLWFRCFLQMGFFGFCHISSVHVSKYENLHLN